MAGNFNACLKTIGKGQNPADQSDGEKVDRPENRLKQKYERLRQNLKLRCFMCRRLKLKQVKDLMTIAKDPNLMEKLTEEFSGEGNDCLQLLLCKLTPFVRGMQKSLSFFAGIQSGQGGERETWAKSKPIERMYLFLPGMKEFVEDCDVCDDQYPLCLY